MNEKAEPYEDNECRHFSTFDNHGILTCKDCGMVYDDTLLEWKENDNI